VKDFELTELRLPRWNALGAEIIHEGMLAGSRAHGEERTQVFIEEVPFLFEAVESAGGFFFCGLFKGEEVFVGELLRGHERFLRRDVCKIMKEERRKKLESGFNFCLV
jgi:hypothetical protein